MPRGRVGKMRVTESAPAGKSSAAVLAAILLAAAFAGGGLLFSGKPGGSELGAAPRSTSWRRTGAPQLVSIEPMPMEGEECEWAAASSSSTLAGELAQDGRSNDLAPGTANTVPEAAIDRAPLRAIRDTYPTYSAIAVDTGANEVYLQDENLFGYKVFNRLDNTPPNANFTEPKRVVAGLKTKMEFNCALYVDPGNGDVYSVNNDTMDTMVVFPRQAQGDVAPMRELHTPHGTFGIAVDEEAQELFLTAEHSNAVLVYSKAAKGDDKPIRTIAGDHTGLADPHGIALDTNNGWVFVSNHGNVKNSAGVGRFEPPSITVYPLKAGGDAAPLRTISGPNAQLNWPAHIYSDPEHGELFVANDVGDSILVFRETDNGDVSPVRVLKGSKTEIKNPTGLYVDEIHDELWVSNMGNHRAVVFPRTANGDVPPRRIIRSAPPASPALAIGNPGATAYDSKREEILVPN